MAKGKLELTWVGKENRPRLEPRVLVEDPAKSYGDPAAQNILIHGDNLLALKALEQDFAGTIKCIYIDPPYNTGSAFTHYDDGMEHSLWLSLIRDRLDVLRRLLAQDGSIWVNLDDNEAHYFRVLADEVFGRGNFLADVIWEKADSPRMDAEFFSARHDHLLVFAKDRKAFRINKGVGQGGEIPAHYDKTDEEGRPFYLKPLRAMGGDDARADRPTLFFPITAPDGTAVLPMRRDGSEGRWRWSAERVVEDRHLIEWVSGRAGWVPYYRIYGDGVSSRPPETIWQHWEVGSNRTSKAEIKALFGGVKAFDTPKPEKLIERVIALGTEPGAWVLDSFAGSGTTGAVAHKMGRRWIMVEIGGHADTHIVPRLTKVIDGTDPGGVTAAVGWKGGGGFKYYRLAESLLVRDKELSARHTPIWIINPKYDEKLLIRSICKIENFRYRNDGRLHGVSSESRFLHVTTRLVTQAYLDSLAGDIGPDQSLLVYCTRKVRMLRTPDNVEIKRIPRDLLSKCDFEEGR